MLDVGFFAHPSTGWQNSIKKQIFNGWPYEQLFGKGYLPFADYSDWGLWCFATQEKNDDGEYPVYLWDHELPDTFDFVSATLHSALVAEISSERT